MPELNGPPSMMPTFRALAERQERGQRVLLEQRVAPGQQEAVEVAAAEQRLADLPFVDASPDGPNGARGAKLLERAVAPAIEQLAHTRVRRATRSVAHHVHVVHEEDVDAILAEPFQARLVRPHHAVVRVVVVKRPPGRVDEMAWR